MTPFPVPKRGAINLGGMLAEMADDIDALATMAQNADPNDWRMFLIGRLVSRLRAAEASALALRAEALEEAAKIVEALVTDTTVDRFMFDGRFAKNSDGHEDFVSSIRMTKVLLKRAATIRSLKTAVAAP